MDGQPPPVRTQQDRIRVEAQLTLTNDELSPLDTQIARDLLTEATNSLESLDVEILRLQASLAEHQALRTLAYARVQILRGGAHRRLPPELLVQVFRYCHTGVVKLPNRSGQSIWTIMQVCTKWRRVVSADPGMWRELHVDPYAGWKPHVREDLVYDILDHRGSGGEVVYDVDIRDHYEWQRTLALVRIYPSRIQGLTLNVSSSCNTDGFRIDTLSFDASPVPSSGQIDIYPHEGVPWTNLTYLNVLRVTIPTLLTILSHCSRITSCVVREAMIRDVEGGSGEHIRLEHLRSLTVKRCEGRGMSEFLECLVLPGLKSLEWDVKYWPPEPVLSLIKRSNCSIEIFRYRGHTTMVTSIPRILEAMPSLVTIGDYGIVPVPQSVIDEIRLKNLAPRLRKVNGWELPAVRPFIELLQSRWEAGSDAMREVAVIITSARLEREWEYYMSILPDLRAPGRDVRIYNYNT